MKAEIKEILDSLKFVIDNPTLEDEVGDEQVTIINYTELNAEESKQLLDYITNLQKSQETLIKNDNEIITNLQEELDRCVKANVILDNENTELQGKINNLQEKIDDFNDQIFAFDTTINTLLKDNNELHKENEKLKELCDKYEEEHSTKFNEWVFDKRENERLKELNENASKVCIAEHKYGVEKVEEARDYKSRCEKAIGFNQIVLDSDYVYSQDEIAQKNINILNGGDKE